MKVTKIICDVCSKEIQEKESIKISIRNPWRKEHMGEEMYPGLEDADFCENCANAIYRFIVEGTAADNNEAGKIKKNVANAIVKGLKDAAADNKDRDNEVKSSSDSDTVTEGFEKRNNEEQSPQVNQEKPTTESEVDSVAMYNSGMSVKDIAASTGMTYAKVYGQLNKAGVLNNEEHKENEKKLKANGKKNEVSEKKQSAKAPEEALIKNSESKYPAKQLDVGRILALRKAGWTVEQIVQDVYVSAEVVKAVLIKHGRKIQKGE